jgi:hypothetical protein
MGKEGQAIFRFLSQQSQLLSATSAYLGGKQASEQIITGKWEFGVLISGI